MFPTGSRKESPFINVHSIEIKSILSHIIYISFILRTWAPWSYPHSINWHWKYTNEERVLLRLRHHLLPLRTRCWREKHQCYSDLWEVWEEEGGWNKNTRPWPTGAQVRPQASWKAWRYFLIIKSPAWCDVKECQSRKSCFKVCVPLWKWAMKSCSGIVLNCETLTFEIALRSENSRHKE